MKTSDWAKTVSRKLRRDQTNAEKMLWKKLRNRQFLGLKFTRQHPIYFFENGRKTFFITDFYCHELKLVIELDGKIHEELKDYDEARENLLKTKKLNMIRFRNEEIEENMNASMIKLKHLIDQKSPSLLSQRKVRDE